MSRITKEELGFPDISDRIYELYIDEMYRLTGKKEPTEENVKLWIQTWFRIMNDCERRLKQAVEEDSEHEQRTDS